MRIFGNVLLRSYLTRKSWRGRTNKKFFLVQKAASINFGTFGSYRCVHTDKENVSRNNCLQFIELNCLRNKNDLRELRESWSQHYGLIPLSLLIRAFRIEGNFLPKDYNYGGGGSVYIIEAPQKFFVSLFLLSSPMREALAIKSIWQPCFYIIYIIYNFFEDLPEALEFRLTKTWLDYLLLAFSLQNFIKFYFIGCIKKSNQSLECALARSIFNLKK